MLFVIHVHDKPGRSAERSAHYDVHKAHIGDTGPWGLKIVMSGPLVADDGTTPVGSHFVVDAPDRVTVETFHKADPFFKIGIWDKASITAFIKRVG